ncbi:MAG: DUF354 domain-containing protein, partial [Bacteroidetes bacterium]|nr:DUF354 domain-containing protein [Bacteroidota bacterium]
IADRGVENERKKLVALLPGSRKQEISRILPVMIEAATKFPDVKFVIAAALSQPDEIYKSLPGDSKIEVVRGKTYQLLSEADAAMVTSGTATLETALFGVPEVVCYKATRISFFIAKRVVSIKFISLVNLIMDQLVVKELIQADCKPDAVAIELDLLLHDEKKRNIMSENFEILQQKLGGSGASERIANKMWNYLNNQNSE